jgi:hypothetical protein
MGDSMDISDISSSMAANSISTQSSILIAKKSLDMMKQQGLNAIALIQGAAPEPGNGNGKLVNLYA